MNDKITITKGTVQETLVFPVYGRFVANSNYPSIFRDTSAKAVMDKVDYDFKSADMGHGGMPSIIYGIRHEVLVKAARDFLKEYPDGIIVNLGCGLDTSFDFIDNGRCRYVNLDLPDVIKLREKLFEPHERQMNLPHDAFDHSWMGKIGAGANDHVYIISGGVFYYFSREDVKDLIAAAAERFPDGGMCFDYESKAMMNMSNRMVKKSGNDGAEMLYYVKDGLKEFPEYSENIRSVEIMKRLPKEYSVLPMKAKIIFGLELRLQMMSFAYLRFR